jgi:hypothetical protein
MAVSKSAGAGGLLSFVGNRAYFPLGYNLRWVPSLKKDGDLPPSDLTPPP